MIIDTYRSVTHHAPDPAPPVPTSAAGSNGVVRKDDGSPVDQSVTVKVQVLLDQLQQIALYNQFLKSQGLE